MWIGAENFTTVETLMSAHQNVPGHIISKNYYIQGVHENLSQFEYTLSKVGLGSIWSEAQ